MRPVSLTIAGLVLATAIAGAVWHLARDPAPPSPAPARPAMEARPSGSTADPARAASPQRQAYRERQRFEREVRGFLAEAANLGALERSERAAVLADEIEREARAARLSAGEAFLLQAALIKATAPDDAAQTAQLAELTARYRADADRREAAWAQRQARDPAFQAYKAREDAIVAEVMAMKAFPDGLTRDQYLRQRLQEAREQSYR